MHFGYFGLTLISFYIYFSHLRGALGQCKVLSVVLMRIVCDFRGPRGAATNLQSRGGCEESAGRVQGG